MLVVTTAHDAGAEQQRRAALVAQRLSAPLVARKGLSQLMADGATLVYVVRAARDEVVDVASGASTHVQPGMLPQKRSQGDAHPLIRAVCGPTGARPLRILDGTAGLLNDALHIAELVPCEVVACEASPVVACLIAEGLMRLARSADKVLAAAANRVTLEPLPCAEVLRRLEPGAVDVVMLDPMMEKPRKASPAFTVMRSLAYYAQADVALIAAARKVAARVVLKLGKGVPVPPGTQAWFHQKEAGRQVTYWVASGVCPARTR